MLIFRHVKSSINRNSYPFKDISNVTIINYAHAHIYYDDAVSPCHKLIILRNSLHIVCWSGLFENVYYLKKTFWLQATFMVWLLDLNKALIFKHTACLTHFLYWCIQFSEFLLTFSSRTKCPVPFLVQENLSYCQKCQAQHCLDRWSYLMPADCIIVLLLRADLDSIDFNKVFPVVTPRAIIWRTNTL